MMKNCRHLILSVFTLLCFFFLTACGREQESVSYLIDGADSEMYLRQGLNEFYARDYDAAYEHFLLSVRVSHFEQSPEDNVIQDYLYLGMISRSRGDYDTAKIWFELAIKHATTHHDTISDFTSIRDRVREEINLNRDLQKKQAKKARMTEMLGLMYAILLTLLLVLGIMYHGWKKAINRKLAQRTREWAGDNVSHESAEDTRDEASESTDAGNSENDTNSYILKKVIRYIEENESYLSPDIRLEDIATAIGTNRTYVSRAINSSNQNFSTLINEYRVKKAISLLDNDRKKINEIIAECGFGSNRSFYDAFKKVTGLSPSEYRNAIRFNRQ